MNFKITYCNRALPIEIILLQLISDNKFVIKSFNCLNAASSHLYFTLRKFCSPKLYYKNISLK